ncbi:hypothetical protein GCM10011583_73090 [Streptomyces camponoticapitis]|uniref:Secreted protein n=1 Tax=Streptomyces camponoticapitis TaxID=1616125 RepID=A0ABQ2F105_9ACTN|nr:hypothetical protein GCM10011583_73090 [Streptomyces camponoticapitis]
MIGFAAALSLGALVRASPQLRAGAGGFGAARNGKCLASLNSSPTPSRLFKPCTCTSWQLGNDRQKPEMQKPRDEVVRPRGRLTHVTPRANRPTSPTVLRQAGAGEGELCRHHIPTARRPL